LLAQSRSLKTETVIPKIEHFFAENFQQEIFCSENLPDKIVFMNKSIDKEKNLCLQGWFVSPFLGAYLEFKWSNGEVFYIFDFGLKKDTPQLYREYDQRGRDFSLKKQIPKDVFSLDVSSVTQGKVRAKKSFAILNEDIKEVEIKSENLMSFPVSDENFFDNKNILVSKKGFDFSSIATLFKHASVVFYLESVKKFEEKNYENLYSRHLLVCRPFKFLENHSAKDKNIFFCFSDESSIGSLQLHVLKDFYASVFIEKSLFLSLLKRQKDFLQGALNVYIVEDLTHLEHRFEKSPKIAFLLSSDTHVTLMKEIIFNISSHIVVVPDPKNKEEGAIKRLNEIGKSYITFGYKQTICNELQEFDPDYVVSMTDWTSEYLALKEFFKGSRTKFITLQEGPHDWDMQFMRNGELYVSNQYRNSEIFISQGPDPLRHIQPKFFSILGTPKIVYEEMPLIKEFLVVINCNFTYEKTKPEYESNRDFWIKSVISVCKKNRYRYKILQHPRDFSNIDDPNVVKTNSSIVKEYIAKSVVVVSRFSSISLEALALNRNSIYYNPHREPMLSFNDKYEGALLISYDEENLEENLKKIHFKFCVKQENLFSFNDHIKTLNFYVNNQDNTSPNRISSFFQKLNDFSLDKNAFENFLKEKKIPTNLKPPKENFLKKYFLIFSMDSVDQYKEENYQLYMLGYKLAFSGHKVYYYTDKIPDFFKKLRSLIPLDDFHLVLSRNHCNNRPVGPINTIIFPFYFSEEKEDECESYQNDLTKKNMFSSMQQMPCQSNKGLGFMGEKIYYDDNLH